MGLFSSPSGGASFGTLGGAPGDNAALAAALAAKLDKTGGIITGNGAASTPALTLNGSVFAGGSATTTKPLFLLEPSGTTSAGWSTSGTILGINAPSGFAGDITHWGVNGTKLAFINAAGHYIGQGINGTYHYFNSGGGFYGIGDGVVRLTNAAGNAGTLQIGGTSSASPAIKKSGSTLQCRVADDSAYAQFDALGYSVGGVSGIDFSGVVTNITVVKGIITAAS